MASFDLQKAREVYFDMKRKYKREYAWIQTANYFGMTIGELSRFWNAAKK